MALMAVNQLRYDQMIEEALRGVVRRALRGVAEQGLPGNHHFYITFKTGAPGVELAPRLKEKYPEEMTIVLQYQFWGLEVGAERFEVTLSFNEVPEKLVVPFAAITAFADPAAKFGLQFQQETGAAPEEANSSATGTDSTGTGAPPARVATRPAAAEANHPAAETKVVTLDNFRRK